MSVKPSERLIALDAFRGLTIAMMILVNTPGSWSHVYSPLRHAKWHGCTPTDLVFPFFLFIVGTAMVFSFKKFNYTLNYDLAKKIVGRMVTIFAFGLVLNAFPFIRQDWDYSSLRILGVLQRIALAYGFAAFLILLFDKKKLWIISSVILFGYWFILWVFGGNDPYSLTENIARTFDSFVIGESHLYRGMGLPFDPEGLLSTLPAIVTVILGFKVGTWIQENGATVKTIKNMIIFGLFWVFIGWVWGWFFPINKQLWTSSYVFYTAGLATIMLAAFLWIIDIKGFKKIAYPFVIFGTNAIFVFTASGLWVKSIIRFKFTLAGETVNGYTYLYETIFVPLAGNLNGSFLFAITHILGWWLILYWLHRREIYIKI